MKTTTLFWLSLVICGSCWTSDAYSQHLISSSIDSPAICRNYNASEATDIDYLPSAVRNLNSSSRYVICPLVVPIPLGRTSYYVQADVAGSVGPNQSITCTLFSYSSGSGTYLGSSSFTFPYSTFKYGLVVPADAFAGASVLCLLPGSAGGQLTQLAVSVITN